MVGVCRKEAVAWVQKNRGMICKKILSVFPYTLQQDVNEFVRDAYVVAIEASIKAERIGVPFEAIFWTDFDSMLKGTSVFFYTSANSDDEDSPMNVHARRGEDPLADLGKRFDREEMISKTVASVLKILSPAEQRVFMLYMGQTEHGFCSHGEAAKILGIDKASAKKMSLRIEKKITGAAKVVDLSKGMFKFDWEKMSRAVRSGKGRASSVSTAVQRELCLSANAVSPPEDADGDLRVAA